ncbi:hypothetical protein M8J76_017087 [Diaphorina citri]|nr:hypothetical protein M8J76_017087 [Diaphorina citri]
MFLNTKGRILYDSIIYKYNDILLIECDVNDIHNFIKHLKMYRVRRKIDIDNVSDVLTAGVVFDPNQNLAKNCDFNGTIKDLEQIVPCSTIYEHDSSFELKVKDILIDKKNIFIYRDPRLSALGVRLIHSKDLDIAPLLQSQNSGDSYTTVRYKLGVAEGIQEIPVGNSFPHEYNCDYLHGVSFHKGCYIGQELTARTQHTGVVRKRIMPLYFKDNVEANSLAKDSVIEDFDKLVKINIGKLRGVHEKYGLALLRIAEALKVQQLKVKDHVAKTAKPSWSLRSFLIKRKYSMETMEHKQPSGMTETQVEIPQAPDRIQNLEKPIENQNKPVEPTASQNNPNISENTGDVTETILTFKCELCNLNETYDFFGKSPPWSTKIVLLENAYICKDPFTIPQKKQVLILGSKCSVCEIDVCVSPKCSLFFSKRFCKHCAFKNMTYFPTQIQMKINKNFAS